MAGPANVRSIDAAGATVATVDHTLVAGTADGFGDVVDGYRNRLVKIQNPAPPHAFVVYDNLDGVVKAAAFSTLPAGNDPEDIDDATKLGGRGAYTETAYSRRGLAYRQRVAIDPTEADPGAGEGFLETHVFFDANARVVGQLASAWGPNGPATKVTYDALGRVAAAYVTDRGGDVLFGTGSHAHVHLGAPDHRANLAGDVVFEQVEYAHRAEVGLLDVVTTRARTHDAADGKSQSGRGG